MIEVFVLVPEIQKKTIVFSKKNEQNVNNLNA